MVVNFNEEEVILILDYDIEIRIKKSEAKELAMKIINNCYETVEED